MLPLSLDFGSWLAYICKTPADGPHQSFWGHPQKSPTREMTPNSGPRGASVNDGIEKKLCLLKYVLVNEATREVLVLGQGTQLAKFDIESAYRLIPVHADDRPLFGMRREKTNIDLALPFGLRSAPKVFNAVADAMQWIFEQHGVKPMLITWTTSSL